MATGVTAPVRAPGFAHECGPRSGRWLDPATEAAAPVQQGRSSPAHGPVLPQGVSGARCPPAALALPVGEPERPRKLWRGAGGPLAHPTQLHNKRVLTLELRQLMQERTPLWPLQGIWEGQLVPPWGSVLPPLPARAGSEQPISCGDWVSSPTPPQLGGLKPYPNPDHLRTSPGTAPQLQSQSPQGLVQLIMHQVDFLGSQPKQLRLAQGNGSPGYCPSAQRVTVQTP